MRSAECGMRNGGSRPEIGCHLVEEGLTVNWTGLRHSRGLPGLVLPPSRSPASVGEGRS